MGYRETQLVLSVEALEKAEREICRLRASQSVSPQLVNEALFRRDLAVEEVQKWEKRVQAERKRYEDGGSEHP